MQREELHTNEQENHQHSSLCHSMNKKELNTAAKQRQRARDKAIKEGLDLTALGLEKRKHGFKKSKPDLADETVSAAALRKRRQRARQEAIKHGIDPSTLGHGFKKSKSDLADETVSAATLRKRRQRARQKAIKHGIDPSTLGLEKQNTMPSFFNYWNGSSAENKDEEQQAYEEARSDFEKLVEFDRRQAAINDRESQRRLIAEQRALVEAQGASSRENTALSRDNAALEEAQETKARHDLLAAAYHNVVEKTPKKRARSEASNVIPATPTPKKAKTSTATNMKTPAKKTPAKKKASSKKHSSPGDASQSSPGAADAYVHNLKQNVEVFREHIEPMGAEELLEYLTVNEGRLFELSGDHIKTALLFCGTTGLLERTANRRNRKNKLPIHMLRQFCDCLNEIDFDIDYRGLKSDRIAEELIEYLNTN